MRDIIFRGKRLDTREWVYGGISIFNGEATIYNMNEVNNAAYDVDIDTVGEYILHDAKRDRKVFEGDVYFIEEEYDEGDERTFFIATYITERCAFTMLSEGEWLAYTGGGGIDAIKDDFEGFRFEMCEDDIVKMHYKGNRWDNPELLKGEAS